MGFFDSAADKLKIASLEKENGKLNDTLLSLQQEKRNLELKISEMENEIKHLKQQVDGAARAGYKYTTPYQDKADTAKQISQVAAASAPAPVSASKNTGYYFRCKQDPDYKYGFSIVSYKGFDPKSIVVPETIGGEKVVSIADEAFQNSPASEIILPNSIKKIGNRAFSGCKNLKHITLPKYLRDIGSGCFEKSGLESIVFPDYLKYIGFECCKECKNLKSVVLGEDLEDIWDKAFAKCSSLESIKLPDGLKIIGNQAFYETDITDIVIPARTDKIGNHIIGKRNHSEIEHINSYVFLGYNAKINGYLFSGDGVTQFTGEQFANEQFTNEHFAKVGIVTPVIYCLPGSEAQKYAQQHNIKCRPLYEYK